MRKLLVLLAVTRFAHADALGEYGDDVSLREPVQLNAGGCDYQLELRGAVVEGWLRDTIDSSGPLALGAVDELVLPRGAQVIGARLDGAAALAVPGQYAAEPANEAVGADPLMLAALSPDDQGHPRVRAIVAPFGRTTTIAVHFTAVADIRGGALHFLLPAQTCRGTVKVTPGPGATLARLRVGNVDTRGPFELHAVETEIVADLAYVRPLAWTQGEPLGDGFIARAQTRIAPLAKPTGAQHVLLMIDGSRSMELVGEPAVAQVVHALAASLPAHCDVEAVIFDRTPARVFSTWRPAAPATFEAIEAALHAHVAGNGSDLIAAFTLAHNLLADVRGETMIVAISDGAFGALGDDALVNALAGGERALELHAIILDRGQLVAQSEEPLRRAVSHYGGSYVEVDADNLTAALAEIDSWLRPAATITGRSLIAGTGTVTLGLARGAATGTPAPIAQLVLARARTTDFAPDAQDDALDRAEKQLAKLVASHPWATSDVAFSVLAARGKVARARHDTVAGGGPFTRTFATPDPAFTPEVAAAATKRITISALDKQLLDTLFRLQLERPAYVCYERAIGRTSLAGTVTFHLEIGRGEVTHASVEGLGDAQFDSCLLEAAYHIVPPMPDPSYNTDDRSVVNYPLTFQLHHDTPVIVAGDADSSSPLDIDSIKAGAPKPRRITPVDTKSPLGDLRPTLQARPEKK